MIAACIVPFILFFSFPYYGIPGDFNLFIFIVLIFVGHSLMLVGHSRHNKSHKPDSILMENQDDNQLS